MPKKKFICANEATAEAVRLARVQIIPGYPITPQTKIIEKIAEFCADGSLNAKFMKMESEHSMFAAAIGAAMTGVRVYIATSSQGLFLANEMIQWASGARLPIVATNVNRAGCAPWALWADQNDSMSVKDAGWIQFYCEDAQEVLDTTLLAFKLSEHLNIPSMIIYEGFLLSHAYEPVVIPDQQTVDKFLPPYKPKFKLDPKNPHSFGNAMFSSDYAETKYLLHEDMLLVPKTAQKFSDDFEKIFGREYQPLAEELNIKKTTKIIVISMGTIASTIKEVIKNRSNIGLIRLKMFRPFPEVFKKIHPSQKVVIIDRNISCGQGGHLWQEIHRHINCFCCKTPKIYGYITGLNGEDVTPEVIENIIEDAEQRPASQEPILWRRQ